MTSVLSSLIHIFKVLHVLVVGFAIAIAIAIAIAGGLDCLCLKDSPIEAWLANGPFGKDK